MLYVIASKMTINRGVNFVTWILQFFVSLDALTKHMAVEWGRDNVRVVGLAPGPIGDTEGMRRLGKSISYRTWQVYLWGV